MRRIGSDAPDAAGQAVDCAGRIADRAVVGKPHVPLQCGHDRHAKIDRHLVKLPDRPAELPRRFAITLEIVDHDQAAAAGALSCTSKSGPSGGIRGADDSLCADGIGVAGAGPQGSPGGEPAQSTSELYPARSLMRRSAWSEEAAQSLFPSPLGGEGLGV